ncbi:Endoribonuclease HigB [Planktothrix agardhii]|jgi:proteic killer suppression protein|nr:Endoribonuclease HigB [Planktothrix agardhii]
MLEDIRLPGYDLHELKGDCQGTWSIKVSGNWRITFSFENGEVYDVNLEDYH